MMEQLILLPRSLCISTVYKGAAPIPNKMNRRAPLGICVTHPLTTGISVTSSAGSLTGFGHRLRPKPLGSSVMQHASDI